MSSPEYMRELNAAEDINRTELNVPKGNIVRITVLSARDRQRYLGVIDRALDAAIKQKIYDKIYNGNPTFYGTMQGSGDIGFNMTANWSKNSASGSVGGMLRELGGKTSMGGTVGAAGDILHAMTGINGSVTGSATMKSYEGTDLNGFSIECGWYLPTQVGLCRLSLGILMRMAYPVQVPDNFIGDNLADAINSAQASTSNGTPPTPGKASNSDMDNLLGETVSSLGAGTLSSLAGTVAPLVNMANNALGRNLTLDPIPVRCSVGQYMDIEPLVIEDVKITFSQNTYLDTVTGRYLPVTCHATITFKFWMNPAPKQEFFDLLGTEMFAEGRDPNARNQIQAALDTVTVQHAVDQAIKTGDAAATSYSSQFGQKSSNLNAKPNLGQSDTYSNMIPNPLLSR